MYHIFTAYSPGEEQLGCLCFLDLWLKQQSTRLSSYLWRKNSRPLDICQGVAKLRHIIQQHNGGENGSVDSVLALLDG